MIYIFLQNNEEDCGWACISNVLEQYGSYITPERIKKQNNIKKEEINALDICKILNSYGVDCSGYEVGENFFNEKKAKEMYIAQIRKQGYFHFVVILQSNGKQITISDPAIGVYKEDISEFNEKFTNILLVPQKREDFKAIKIKEYFNWRFLLNSFSKGKIIWLLVATIFAASFEFVNGYFFKEIVDNIVPHNNLTYLFRLSLVIIIYTLFIAIITYIRNRLSLFISQNSSEKVFNNYIKKTLNQPLNFFSEKKIGDFSSRISDILELADNLIYLIITVIINAVIIFVFSMLLGQIELNLLVVMLVYFLCYFLIASYFNKKYGMAFNNVKEQYAFFEDSYIKAISAIFSVKTFIQSTNITKKLINEFKITNKKTKEAFTIQNWENSVLFLLQNVFEILVIIFAVGEIVNRKITVGDFVFLITILQYLDSSFDALTQIQPSYQKLKVSTNRVFSFVDNERELDVDTVSTRDRQIEKNIGKITFKKISVSLQGKRVFDDYSSEFNFGKGEVIGLSGKSGVGKSTLMRTLVKLIPIENGEILINNKPISLFSKNVLRSNILLLNQTPQFIPYYSEGISSDNLKEIDRLFDMFGLKKELHIFNSDSLDYVLGIEDNLSGGQKQRVYISLGLALKPKLIVLDESLSGLNDEWIDVFFDYVKKKKISTIIISHDLSILDRCNQKVLILPGTTINMNM